MLAVVAIIGRPNVGKSTLFNCLTSSHCALVADEPGVTRDRLYGYTEIEGRQVALVDTGGLLADPSVLSEAITAQVWQAVEASDLVMFVVDAKCGLHPLDQVIAQRLYRLKKPLLIIVNKSDGMDEQVAASDFYQLGFSEVLTISALHRRGVKKLMQQIMVALPDTLDQAPPPVSGIGVTVIGRPNVGKSTLINTLIGEERVIAHDMAGTTRDAVTIPFEHHGQAFTLIDTAGVRRRSKVKLALEKGAIVKTLRAIHAAHVVIMMVDGNDDLMEQDLKLIALALKAGRSLVIAINKWDLPSQYERGEVERAVDRRLNFIPFVPVHFISALHGKGVEAVLRTTIDCYQAASQSVRSSYLTTLLEKLLLKHSPPLVQGRRVKLRYAHLGGHYPFTIVIHGKQLDKLPLSYTRYLENSFRQTLKLVGTPINIRFKNDTNPYRETTNA